MTKWRPDPKALQRPAHASLAEQIARAVESGTLQAGSRLPPQRQMAHDLGLSVQTVWRAYETLIRRGLLSGEVGRGTFVLESKRERQPPYLPERLGEIIDLSILKPVCDRIHHEKLKQGLAWLSESLPVSSALSFRPNIAMSEHRNVAREWLKFCGLDIQPQLITITNGATAAICVALMSVATPGAGIASEAIGLHTLPPLARYLGLNLVGVRLDDEGLTADGLAEICERTPISALFIQPSLVNPTATLMGIQRREKIIDIARRYDLTIIESDVLGPMIDDRPPPLASLAPERTLYITSFTKTVAPGLRIGYLAVPEKYLAAVSNRHMVSNWMATAIVADVASKWVSDGTAMELVNWQRTALRKRLDVVRGVLPDVDYRAHQDGLHLWLPLPPDRDEDSFVAQARLQGVAVAPGSSFRIAPTEQAPAVRVSLGSASESDLRTGLLILRSLLLGAPEEALLAV